MGPRAENARRDAKVGPDHEPRVRTLGGVIGRGEHRQGKAEGDHQADADRSHRQRPRTPPQAAGQRAPDQGTESRSRRHGEARGGTLEEADGEQHSPDPGDQRRHQHAGGQRHRLPRRDRRALGIEGAAPKRDELGNRRDREEHEIEPQAPPCGRRRHRHLTPFADHLATERSSGRDVEGDRRGHHAPHRALPHPEKEADDGDAQDCGGHATQPVGQPLEETAAPDELSALVVVRRGSRHFSLLQEASSATTSVTS